MALGPVLGGVLVGLSWRAVFLVNIPIDLTAIALTARFVLYLRDVRGLSPLSAGLCTLPIAAMTVLCSTIAGRDRRRARGSRLARRRRSPAGRRDRGARHRREHTGSRAGATRTAARLAEAPAAA